MSYDREDSEQDTFFTREELDKMSAKPVEEPAHTEKFTPAQELMAQMAIEHKICGLLIAATIEFAGCAEESHKKMASSLYYEASAFSHTVFKLKQLLEGEQ